MPGGVRGRGNPLLLDSIIFSEALGINNDLTVAWDFLAPGDKVPDRLEVSSLA